MLPEFTHEQIQAVIHPLFPTGPTFDLVREGMSTVVYRLHAPGEVCYLRILPEMGETFAPEIKVLTVLNEAGVKVPQVRYFTPYDAVVERSVMVVTEIKGKPMSQSPELLPVTRHAILQAAGRDLAQINRVPIGGFGWIQRTTKDTGQLQASWPTFHAMIDEFWQEDLAFLARATLQPDEVAFLAQFEQQWRSYTQTVPAALAHGDFDLTHIYQFEGCYTGIIDFGEIRGAPRWYDLGYFHLRDGEQVPDALFPFVRAGYEQQAQLSSEADTLIRVTSIFITVRSLANSLQKRPANRSTQHQLERLRADLSLLR